MIEEEEGEDDGIDRAMFNEQSSGMIKPYGAA